MNAEGKYHHLVLIHQAYLETFMKVVANAHQYVRDGNSYRVKDVSCVALISQMSIPEGIINFLSSKPSLLQKAALYDMSPLFEGKGFV
ncbi:MAG: hypothetical protein QXU95_02360 [Candidatus Bathyarchaeia archaeon]|nr:hypothetical protein [Candidatus Bathyarchaeota archaeon]